MQFADAACASQPRDRYSHRETVHYLNGWCGQHRIATSSSATVYGLILVIIFFSFFLSFSFTRDATWLSDLEWRRRFGPAALPRAWPEEQRVRAAGLWISTRCYTTAVLSHAWSFDVFSSTWCSNDRVLIGRHSPGHCRLPLPLVRSRVGIHWLQACSPARWSSPPTRLVPVSFVRESYHRPNEVCTFPRAHVKRSSRFRRTRDKGRKINRKKKKA